MGGIIVFAHKKSRDNNKNIVIKFESTPKALINKGLAAKKIV